MNTSETRWLRWCLTAIAVLLTVIAVELSALLGPLMPRAQAQIPDSGLQRQQQLEGQDRTNALLDAILQHLRTQPVKVKLVGTDKETKPESKEAPQPRRK
jgi:hypothetical protein